MNLPGEGAAYQNNCPAHKKVVTPALILYLSIMIHEQDFPLFATCVLILYTISKKYIIALCANWKSRNIFQWEEPISHALG